MADPDHTLTQSILRDIRRDQKQLQDLLLTFIETTRRRFDSIERQIKDGNADLELMLKGELLGRLTHFETRMDERFAAAEDRNKSPTAS